MPSVVPCLQDAALMLLRNEIIYNLPASRAVVHKTNKSYSFQPLFFLLFSLLFQLRLQSFTLMQQLLRTHQWYSKQRNGPTQHVVLGLRQVFASRLLSNCSSRQLLSVSASVMSARSIWPAQGARIVLGSSSYSRQEIMKELAQEFYFDYEVITADIDEKALGDRTADPAKLVTLLAQAKAVAIRKRMQSTNALPVTGLLLTCDQVVICQNSIREKPTSVDEAKAFIASYSQHPAGTVGSTLCTDLESGQSFGAVDQTWTHFTQIPEEVIQQMVEEGTVMKCAGGLMIENPLLEPFITRFDGAKDAIMGLPKDTVLRLVGEAVKASRK